MKFTVEKCFCCFDLKLGMYSWGIFDLVFRVTFIFMVDYYDAVADEKLQLMLKSILPVVGFFVATTIGLCVAMIGIAREKSILIYPYLTIVIVELTVVTIVYITAAIMVSGFYIIVGLVEAGVGIYFFICLSSLYNQIKQAEEKKSELKDGNVMKPIEQV